MSSNILQRHQAMAAQMQEYLSQRFFMMTLLAALLLHFSALAVWMFMPHVQVVEIPVRALNIKLGDGDDITPEDIHAANVAAAGQVGTMLSQLVHDMAPQTPTSAPAKIEPPVAAKTTEPAAAKPVYQAPAIMPQRPQVPPPVRHVSEPARQNNEVAQFVREPAAQNSVKGTGSALGNSTASNAETATSYNQLISMWVDKFKYRTPESQTPGMGGTTLVRIRLDRHGNILYYTIEKSSGFQILDRLAVDILRRANPVPEVPQDYPGGDTPEILFPMVFEALQ